MTITSNYLRELFCEEDSIFKNVFSLIDNSISFLTISSIFIAIVGFLLPFFSFKLYGTHVNFGLLLASFFLTFTVYNLNKITDAKEDSINLPDRSNFIGKNRRYIIIAVIASLVVALLLSFLENPSAIYIILFPFCIGFVYSIKIRRFRLKDLTGIKSTAVALSWAVIGTFLPLADHSRDYIQIILVFYFFLLSYSLIQSSSMSVILKEIGRAG